jgi:hypothetical protein
MIRKFMHAEHLLWMTPIIYGIITYFFAPTAVSMTFVLNGYLIMGFPQITTGLLLLLFLPFMLHVWLRDYNLRHFTFCWSHVFASVAMVVAILFILGHNLPVNVEWRYRGGELPAMNRWDYLNQAVKVIVQVFVLTQLVFSAYAGIVLVRNFWKNFQENRQPEELVEEEPKTEEAGVRQMVA